MSDLGKITITKNKDCDNKTYYSAYIYGIDVVIGGGDTRNEAKDELFGNIVFYVNYLIETNQQIKQQLEEKDKEIESLTNRTNRYENMFRSRINRAGDVQKDIELYVKQLAIQELEKVKNFVDGRTYCADYINKRIQELKGE